MKILYITTDGGWGGSSVALYNIIAELKDKHNIYVLLPSIKGRLGQELEKIGITCYYQRLGGHCIYPRFHTFKEFVKHNWWFFRDFYYRGKAKKFVSHLLDFLHPDIVHVNVGPIDISLDACVERNIPHVWHLREYQDKDFKMHYFPSQNKFRKRIKIEGNYCISISNDIFSHWSLQSGKDKVIYDGVIPSGTKSLSLDKEKYFLFVGRVQKGKGTLEAIIAFCDFNKTCQGYKLLIVGNWNNSEKYMRTCRDYVDRNGLNKNVLFLGQRSDVYVLMAKATAILVPSYFEGFGFITVEAMFNNCIVIGRNTGGTKEQFDIGLRETKHEIALRFNKDNEIPALMQRAVKEDLTAMKKFAHQTVCKHYISTTSAIEVEKFYNYIIESRNNAKQ